jgi:purine-binding chemotaxis protein CheW
VTGRAQYATLLLGGHHLGIEVLDVQEVLREQRLTPVPLAPEWVAGLINLRGQIVPELDMRRLLGMPPRAEEEVSFSVVLRTEHGAVSLRVDEIEGVVDLDAGSFDAIPQNVDERLRALLLGVHKLKDRLLLILDTRQAVNGGAE